MVKLNDEQKYYITKTCSHPKEVIYYIEQRVKNITETTPLQQMIEWAELMIEEQSFWEEDFSSKNDD